MCLKEAVMATGNSIGCKDFSPSLELGWRSFSFSPSPVMPRVTMEAEKYLMFVAVDDGIR